MHLSIYLWQRLQENLYYHGLLILVSSPVVIRSWRFLSGTLCFLRPFVLFFAIVTDTFTLFCYHFLLCRVRLLFVEPRLSHNSCCAVDVVAIRLFIVPSPPPPLARIHRIALLFFLSCYFEPFLLLTQEAVVQLLTPRYLSPN